MGKAIELAKRISKSLEENWLLHLEEINLHTDFGPLYKLGYSQKIANAITCFIIFSYDPDSNWIDLNKDRYENKVTILKGLGFDQKDGTFKSIFEPIIEGNNDEVREVVMAFILSLKDYRWEQVYSLLDYSSKMLRFCNSRTIEKKLVGTDTDKESGSTTEVFEETDIETIIVANEKKGKLLQQAIERREEGELILKKIKADFVKTDRATQTDFNFEFSDTASEKLDIYSWRQYIRRRNEKKQSA